MICFLRDAATAACSGEWPRCRAGAVSRAYSWVTSAALSSGHAVSKVMMDLICPPPTTMKVECSNYRTITNYNSKPNWLDSLLWYPLEGDAGSSKV